MKIVVLDGYTLNPGDLSWEPLKQLGDCEIYDRSASGEIIGRLANAEATFTNKIVISREMMEKLPALRYIGVTATGFNIIDVAAAKERGITVTNVPAYGTDSVAQATIALLLELTNHVGHHAQTVRDGRWSKCPDFCYWDYPLIELSGLTMGIVGYGRIGRQVGRIAKGFGMKVLAYRGKATENVQAVELEPLLKQSDVVSLHCPLTPETKGLINRTRLAMMKPTAFLLNTSRGALIVDGDLADALHKEKIAGAGLDVLTVEPPLADNPLFKAPNCFITPHQAWATRAARQRLMSVSVENLRRFVAAQPQNVVN